MTYRLKPREVTAYRVDGMVEAGSWIVVLDGNVSVFSAADFRAQFDPINGSKPKARKAQTKSKPRTDMRLGLKILALLQERARTVREITDALAEIGKPNVWSALHHLKKTGRVLYDADRATYRLARIKENTGK